MSGSGQDALPEVQVWSDDPPGCPGVVGRPSRMSLSDGRSSQMFRSGRQAYWMSGSGQEALLDDQE